MTPIGIISGPAVVLDRPDIDTDQILPVRFLALPRGSDLAAAVFHDLRAADPTVPLRPAGNPHERQDQPLTSAQSTPPVMAGPDPAIRATTVSQRRHSADDAPMTEPTPPILLAREHFGRGAWRDEAAHALLDAGIRCVIAPGFGAGFAEMAGHNGLLALVLTSAAFTSLQTDCRFGAEVIVDLDRQRIGCADLTYRFTIDRFRKRRLLTGSSELQLTLSSELADAIDRFEGADLRDRPWATPT